MFDLRSVCVWIDGLSVKRHFNKLVCMVCAQSILPLYSLVIQMMILNNCPIIFMFLAFVSSCFTVEERYLCAYGGCVMNTTHPSSSSTSPVLYGELTVLGYNGRYNLAKIKQKNCVTKYLLRQKIVASGVRKSCHYAVKAAKQTKAVNDRDQHSISYTLSRNQAIIVEYAADETTDMFQVGRSTDVQIDFTVVDTCIASDAESGDDLKEVTAPQSTISRYACRILVERCAPYKARVYAAGFDMFKNIFLGEKACKWKNGEDVDGLTTNGVLILHPKWNQTSEDAYVWREVSVGGSIYTLRPSRSSIQRGRLVEDENNVLDDGTLIDLCGATLLWRSAEGLNHSPSEAELESRLEELNSGRPQCPVNLNTLYIPKRKTVHQHLSEERSPYVYLSCGHVQGKHGWGHKVTSQTHECPLCNIASEVMIQLSMGMEPSFHLDCDKLTHCFNPCGHMASEKTVKYWSRIPMPQGTSTFKPICPFCATTLAITKPYVRLIFQDHCSF